MRCVTEPSSLVIVLIMPRYSQTSQMPSETHKGEVPKESNPEPLPRHLRRVLMLSMMMRRGQVAVNDDEFDTG